MAKKGLLMCVCQGTCPSFQGMNIFEVLNTLRREGVVDFVALHPQLCADDGDAFLKVLLKDSQIDKLFVAGCDPKMQRKMYKDAFEEAGFSKDKHEGIDIRNMSTEEAIRAIKEALQRG